MDSFRSGATAFLLVLMLVSSGHFLTLSATGNGGPDGDDEAVLSAALSWVLSVTRGDPTPASLADPLGELPWMKEILAKASGDIVVVVHQDAADTMPLERRAALAASLAKNAEGTFVSRTIRPGIRTRQAGPEGRASTPRMEASDLDGNPLVMCAIELPPSGRGNGCQFREGADLLVTLVYPSSVFPRAEGEDRASVVVFLKVPDPMSVRDFGGGWTLTLNRGQGGWRVDRISGLVTGHE